MCDPETAFIAKPIAEAAGFKFWKPLVWNKITIGMGYHYRARYEFVLFFEKGKRKLADLGIADVLDIPRIRGGYPAEKPVALSEVLLRQSTEGGALVVDPFMGSGSTGVAALGLGRRFLGNDVADSSLEHARRRLLERGGREGQLLSPAAPSLLAPDQMRLALG
jgi:site-specific DNA-methyltransferase (adenine-specific)